MRLRLGAAFACALLIGCDHRQPITDGTQLSLSSASSASAVDVSTRDSLSRFAPGSPMADLARRFIVAAPARAAIVVGSQWVATRTVRTQRFLAGGSGPDQVAVDETGLRAESGAYHWTIQFQPEEDGRLRVIQFWDGEAPNDHSLATYNADSTLSFSLSAGGEEPAHAWCRAPDSEQLICLDLEHIGEGTVFRRSPSAQ